LRGRSSRGHGEIGIAAEVAQKGNLIVEAAEPAAGQGVIECSEPMNESEGNDAVVFPQQAVAGEQCFGEPANAVNEVLLAFAVVVQVDLDVSDSMRRHMFQRFHEVGSILLLGIEKRITGGTTGRILKLRCNGRPTGCPSSDPLCPGILTGTVPERLIVISKEQPEPLSGLAPERGKPILDIPWEPDLGWWVS